MLPFTIEKFETTPLLLSVGGVEAKAAASAATLVGEIATVFPFEFTTSADVT